jgi:hypothetical protein
MHVWIFSTITKQNHGSEREEKCNKRSTMGENPTKIPPESIFFPKVKSIFFPQVVSTYQPFIKTPTHNTHNSYTTRYNTLQHTSTGVAAISNAHTHFQCTVYHCFLNSLSIHTGCHCQQHRSKLSHSVVSLPLEVLLLMKHCGCLVWWITLILKMFTLLGE